MTTTTTPRKPHYTNPKANLHPKAMDALNKVVVKEPEARKHTIAPQSCTVSQLQQALLTAAEHKMTHEGHDGVHCFPTMRMVETVVLSPDKGEVNTIAAMAELISKLEYLEPVDNYIGPDKNRVLVVQARLPQGYIAIPTVIADVDYPPYVHKMSLTNGQLVSVNTTAAEVWRKSGEDTFDNYQMITFRLMNSPAGLSLKNWKVGPELDIKFNGSRLQTVLLGENLKHSKKPHHKRPVDE